MILAKKKIFKNLYFDKEKSTILIAVSYV